MTELQSRWKSLDDDKGCLAWARGFYDATPRFASGVCVNVLGEEGEARVREACGPAARRPGLDSSSASVAVIRTTSSG